MAIDPEIFIHESDRAALKALKAIPGFTQVLKAFMKIFNESQYKILNMSTYMKISDDQMPEYYAMLKPICEKLGIKVPDLYISLDPRPNAYTSGDTDPFIVVTSGLLSAFPKELLPVVLAHECGHIVCHHVLYKTMGVMILNGAAELMGLSGLLTVPLKAAFYYWMRCSEYSADRVAAVCCGDSDVITEMCMRFAGYQKDNPFEANKEAFMAQAHDYKKLIKESAFNKSLEFLMFAGATHPMNAVRAYECKNWTNTYQYRYAVQFLQEESDKNSHERIPMTKSAKDYVQKDYNEVLNELRGMGFTNMYLIRMTEKTKNCSEGKVTEVTIGGKTDYTVGTWVEHDEKIVIYYYQPRTYVEVKAAHPDEPVAPADSTAFIGRNYNSVMAELRDAGFAYFETAAQPDLKMGILNSVGDIASISIDGAERFEAGTIFPKDAVVYIKYHVFESAQ